MSGVLVVLCTAPPERARDLADRLLEERLVACVNLVGPVVSRYWWEGAVAESREVLLVMKTAARLAARLRARIVELHEYSVPEVLELRAEGGLPAYLDWVSRACAT